MGTYVRRILSDQGDLFAAYNSTVSTFVSPCFDSVEKLAEYCIKKIGGEAAGWKYEPGRTASDEVDCDMRSAIVVRCLRSIAELKRGSRIYADDACLLVNFHEFLHANTAPHQNKLTGYQKLVKDWIEELDLAQYYSADDCDDDILDNCKTRAFYKFYSARRYGRKSAVRGLSRSRTRPEHRILAGRYLNLMAKTMFADGRRRQSPDKIINHFLR
jgi:hypothetical protein